MRGKEVGTNYRSPSLLLNKHEAEQMKADQQERNEMKLKDKIKFNGVLATGWIYTNAPLLLFLAGELLILLALLFG